MSDVSPGVGIDAPGSYRDTPSAGDRAKQVAHEGRQAAGDVKETAKEQTQRVVQEAGAQARNLASDVRGRVGEQARTQNDKLVGTIRDTADQLDEMRGERTDGPAAAVVSRVADGGRQFADYLDRHGPDGVLREVQDFARRRPGAFLATALAAGFVVGRLGKSVAKADDKPETDAYVSRDPGPATTQPVDPAPVYAEPVYAEPAAPVATEYVSTGTGTPDAVPPVPERPFTDRPGGGL